jgi:hypothetical protein
MLVTLAYESVFANGDAVERFVYRIEGKRALLVKYDLRSDVFAAN